MKQYILFTLAIVRFQRIKFYLYFLCFFLLLLVFLSKVFEEERRLQVQEKKDLRSLQVSDDIILCLKFKISVFWLLSYKIVRR